MESQQMSIAGDHEIGTAAKREFKKFVVGRVYAIRDGMLNVNELQTAQKLIQ
jgi:hypothetical protein